MSTAFKLNLGIKDLQIKLAEISKYDATTQDKIRSAVQTSTARIAAGARQRVRVKSGMLMKNITMSYDSAKNEGEVHAKTFYAHFLEFGAKAVTVKPKTKKALHGGVIAGFASHVNVPARVARPFLGPAFEEEKPNLIKAIEDAINP